MLKKFIQTEGIRISFHFLSIHECVYSQNIEIFPSFSITNVTSNSTQFWSSRVFKFFFYFPPTPNFIVLLTPNNLFMLLTFPGTSKVPISLSVSFCCQTSLLLSVDLVPRRIWGPSTKQSLLSSDARSSQMKGEEKMTFFFFSKFKLKILICF